MECDKISLNDKPSPHTSSPSPLYVKRFLNAKRQYSESILRVKVSGAEMYNIYRAYHGRLNISYRRLEDSKQVCADAMDLLDQIVIFRGCEPSVIISYIAIVREVYLHACSNLKKEDISIQERKTKMLEQWRQIEKHFAKIKYAMLDCWPIGNESDLMAVYVSIALLYSLYKDVSDEKIIRQCYEAVERARKCNRANLSESQSNEVQQYCDMIENIFFLRHQRSTMNNGSNEYVNNNIVNHSQSGDNGIKNDNHLQLDNQQQLATIPEVCINFLKCDPDNSLNCHSALKRVKDGPAILAEYGQLTTVGKTLTSEKICQKRLRPSDFEIKTAQKKLKCQKPKNSQTLLTEFEAVLLARNAVGNGEFEFPRPSDLKSNRNLEIFKSTVNSRHCRPKSKLPDISAAENLGNVEANSENLNSSNSIVQVLESSVISPVKSQSFMNQKENKMASVKNITNKDTLVSGSSQDAADTAYSSSTQDEVFETKTKKIEELIKQTQTNTAFSKIQSYANEFVEKIVRSVIGVNDEPRKCSRRNSETIHITDTVTSVILTSNNCPEPKQISIIMLNNGSEEIRGESDGMNKNVLIQAKRILKENEDVITESVAVGVITDPNSNDMLRRDKYNSERISDRMIVVEDYAEMELSHGQTLESFCNLQQTSKSFTNSDLSLIPLRVKLSTSVPPESIITFSNSADSGNKSMRDRKKMKTDSVADIPEEWNKKEEKMHKLVDDEDEIESYIVPDHLNEMHKAIRKENNEKFGEISEPLQKPEASKQQQLSAVTEASIITVEKVPLKQTGNQIDPDYILKELDDTQEKHAVTATELFASRRNIFSGTAKNISNVVWTNKEVIPSTPNNQNDASTGQEDPTALIHPDDFNCSSDSPPIQILNYTPEMSLMEIIPDVIENLVDTLEQYGTNEIKSQNELLSKEILFKKYINFEPPSCRLQRVPEFDAMPLSTEQLLPKSKSRFQMFPARSTISDQIKHHQFMSHSTKKVSRSFSDIIHSSSGETGLKATGFRGISTVQIEPIVKPSLHHKLQASLTPDATSLISSPSQVIANNSESITSPRTNQESIITEFKINEYIASKQKIGKESIESTSKPVLEKFFFTRNDTKYHQREETRLNPEIQQTGLRRPQIVPPPRQQLNKPTSVSSKPSLLYRPKHLFITGEKPIEASASEANFSDYDDKKSGFIASEICQASSSQETGLSDTLEEKSSEFGKPRYNTINKEQQKRSKIRTICDLKDKLLPCREGSNERMSDSQATKTSSTSMEIIQIPHFDAKAEFDRRLSIKKSHLGEVPVIVKSAVLKSKSKLPLSRCLTDELLISPISGINDSEKPDFNFIIRKK